MTSLYGHMNPKVFWKLSGDLISVMYNPRFSAKKWHLGDPAWIRPEFPSQLLGHVKWLFRQFRTQIISVRPPKTVSTFFRFFPFTTSKVPCMESFGPQICLGPITLSYKPMVKIFGNFFENCPETSFRWSIIHAVRPKNDISVTWLEFVQNFRHNF